MHKVLVYGSLRKNYGNHRLLVDSKFLGMASAKGVLYSLGAYPGVALEQDGNVVCECYEVDDATLERLDRLEGHPTFYERKEVESEHGPAWIYALDQHPEYLTRGVESGDWSKRA